MKTVFLILLCIGCVIVSPLLLLSVSIRLTPITQETIKNELTNLRVYTTAANELQKQVDATAADAASDDPMRIVAPFVKKEITPEYLRQKAEQLIDDTGVWIRGGTVPPVLSFSDLKDKLVKQNRNILDQLQSVADEMAVTTQNSDIQSQDGADSSDISQYPAFNADDIKKFISSDFTIPVGEFLSGVKFMAGFTWYMLLITAGILAINLLLIVLIAKDLQAKLRWLGVTFLFTAIWNIPGILLGVGSSVMITSFLTQNIHGIAASVAKPFVETIITPVLLSYTRIDGGVVIALSILSIGMIVLSFFAKTSEVDVPVSGREKRPKSKK